MEHTAAIYWPNGAGHRECSQAYADMAAAKEALQSDYDAIDWHTSNPRRANGDSAKLYNEYHAICHQLDQMMGGGHLGRVVRY